jgi:ABC-type nitrate/sulfonate/bicarbonate transport system permease component
VVARLRNTIDWRGFILPVSALLLTEIVAIAVGFESNAFARPSEIAGAAMEAMSDGSMLKATRETLTSAFGGLAIGASLGLALGVLLGLSPIAYWLMEVTLESVRPIPSVALIPVVLLIFGLGHAMEITLVAKSSMWPIFFLSHAAVRGVKPRLLEVSRLLGMGLLERVRKIVLPAALPGIFVGLRLSVASAMIVSVTVEVAANPLGLGHAMMLAEERLRPDLVFAYLFWIGLVGWTVNYGILWLQRRLLRVPTSQTATVAAS